jgi:hypothetical protein
MGLQTSGVRFEESMRFVAHQTGLLLETKAKRVHRGCILLDAMVGIGEKQFALNVPAFRLRQCTRGTTSNFLSGLPEFSRLC